MVLVGVVNSDDGSIAGNIPEIPRDTNIVANTYREEQLNGFSRFNSDGSKLSWAEQVDASSGDEIDIAMAPQEPTREPFVGKAPKLGSSSPGSSCDSTIDPLERECFLLESPCDSTTATVDLDSFDPESFCGSDRQVPAWHSSIHSNDMSHQLNGMNPVQCIPVVLIDPEAMWPTFPQTMARNYYTMYHSSDPDTSGCQIFPTSSERIPEVWMSTRTVMMRNLPNKYTEDMLEEEIKQAGFCGYFNSIHLPMDDTTRRNKGYAFLDFIDAACAWSFKCYYEGRKMQRFNSAKYVTVVPAAIQGFESNRVATGISPARPVVARQKQFRKGHGRRSLIDEAMQKTQPQQVPSTDNQVLDGETLDKSLDANIVQEESVPSRATAKAYCPCCGSKVRPEFVFCIFCGKGLA